jgi:hypothetical protein
LSIFISSDLIALIVVLVPIDSSSCGLVYSYTRTCQA